MVKQKLDLYAYRTRMAEAYRECAHVLGPSSMQFLSPSAYMTAKLVEGFFSDFPRRSFGVISMQKGGERAQVHEEIVSEDSFCSLLHFTEEWKRRNFPRVCIVTPMDGHRARYFRAIVEHFCVDHEVFVSDWKDAKMVPFTKGDFSLHSFVEQVRSYWKIIRRGGPFHVVAIGSAVVPTLVAASLEAQSDVRGIRPLSLVLIGGAIDPRLQPTHFQRDAFAHPREEHAWRSLYEVPPEYPGYCRQVYPGFLDLASLVGLDPRRTRRLPEEEYLHYLKLLFQDIERTLEELREEEKQRAFADEYCCRQDIPGRYYLDWLEFVFQKFALPFGSWKTPEGVLVDPRAIMQSSILVIAGKDDPVVPSAQAKAALDLLKGVSDSRKAYYEARTSHHGLFVGPEFEGKIYQTIREFIRGANKK